MTEANAQYAAQSMHSKPMRVWRYLPASIVLALGIPLIFIVVMALVDGVSYARQAPLRAVLGNTTFDALQGGQRTPQHYMGERFLAPDFTLRDQHGQPWRLRSQRGRLVVMNFWSVTCAPCIEEIPSLQELAWLTEGWGDVDVVMVSIDKNWEAVSPVFESSPRFPVLFDPQKKVVRELYGTRLYPETWVIDKQGLIRLRLDGKQAWSSPVMLDVLRALR